MHSYARNLKLKKKNVKRDVFFCPNKYMCSAVVGRRREMRMRKRERMTSPPPIELSHFDH